MSEAPTIIFEERDALALVRLNRAARRNALTVAMLERLGEVFAAIAERREQLRAVILTGTGVEAFSAGTDINDLAALDVEGAHRAARRGQQLCDRIEQCGVPVIAAINGLAAGGGCELALACHIRLASTNARFSLPETRLGVIPGYGGTWRTPRAIGSGRALQMMLTGQSVLAEEALRIGLVNRVTDPAHLLSEAESLAREISELAPLAIRACLQAVIRGQALSLEEGLALEAELFSSLFATEDMREGTRAFLEKRAPAFKGR